MKLRRAVAPELFHFICDGDVPRFHDVLNLTHAKCQERRSRGLTCVAEGDVSEADHTMCRHHRQDVVCIEGSERSEPSLA